MSTEHPSAKALLVLERDENENVATVSKTVSSSARQMLADVLPNQNGLKNEQK